jgi:hypothetical protein
VPITHGGVCGTYRERIRRRELHDDGASMEHQQEFDDEDVDDPYAAGNEFDYEIGKDPELFWCWQRFEREARERKWSQVERNRQVAEFSHHLRRQLGQATADTGYVNARRNKERA